MTAETAQPFVPPHRTWTGWVRQNLFNKWYNSVLTVVIGAVVLWVLLGVLRALFSTDYTILQVNLRLFMIGQFPASELWRPWASGMSLGLAVGLGAGLLSSGAEERAMQAGIPFRRSSPQAILRRSAPLLVLVAVILALTETWTPTLMVLAISVVSFGAYAAGRRFSGRARRWGWAVVLIGIAGGYLALAGFGGVGWSGWGGLHLNVFLTIAGITFAFPLGLLLALGRRSSLPAVRALSVTYIELVRGVPLIAVLLFGALAIGFLLPEGLRPSLVTRMLIAVTAFQAAYVAEVVRGGLQSLPKGQIEAGQSLGLSAWKTTRLIVLPQALRATIPPMVGQFIALYKDTTLVSILGVLELLRVAFAVNSQPQFLGQGLFAVTLAFAGLIFWVGSYTMSREARRLEKKLGVGER
jgi:general L-amino acid transport system permease protein